MDNNELDNNENKCERLINGAEHSCSEIYNCCDCGGDEDSGCGCSYCWSCNACDFCKNGS